MIDQLVLARSILRLSQVDLASAGEKRCARQDFLRRLVARCRRATARGTRPLVTRQHEIASILSPRGL